MNYLFSLPSSLKTHIFSFDSTYHEVYNFIIQEFLLKTTLWRVKWLNRAMDFGNIDKQNEYQITDFESTRKGIQYIVEYWNRTLGDRRTNIDIKENCEQEFITDNFEGTKHIMNKLNMLKKYRVRTDHDYIGQKEWILYKPGKGKRYEYSNFRVDSIRINRNK